MDALFEIDDRDVLQSWIAGQGRRRRVAEPPDVVVPGVRFAFYGRTSTAEFQDPVTSRAWQREVAATLIAGHGTITTEFFDVGVSRRAAWERRPQAAVLLKRAQNPDRLFDAVVVGEFERAFADRQLEQVALLLQRDGMLVWLPERVARLTSTPLRIGCCCRCWPRSRSGRWCGHVIGRWRR
jgi:site-specific DNA recombinase